MSKISKLPFTPKICLVVGSVDHAEKLAKALRDVRYSKLSAHKTDAAFALEVLRILYGMPELRMKGQG